MRGTASALVAIAAFGATVRADKPVFEPTAIEAPFLEQFTSDWSSRWTPSEATKKTPVGGETFSYVGKWSVEESSKYPTFSNDVGLVAKSPASHHAISAPLTSTLDPAGKTLVVQYEVKFQKGGNCGGGYLKLLEDGFENDGPYNDKTPWVIMFGPDLTCPGTKVHFIFRHQNPITKEFEEKHLTAPPTPLINEATKLYTLIVKPDNTFEILIDQESVKVGDLLENFSPAVNPPTEIDDADDKKPADWVDDAQMPDPDAVKPADWDEDAPYSIPDEEAEIPEGWLTEEATQIPDPDAEKPEEWDDEEDGDWIAPTVPNPLCEEAPGCGEWVRPTKANPDFKGKWSAPLIDHPGYKGVWAPRKIANPDYFEDKTPANFHKIGGVGFEIWTMTEDILFDNIYVGHSPEDAKALADSTFALKKKFESEEAVKASEAEVKKPAAGGSFDFEAFKANPVEWIRQQAFTFVELAKLDPVSAFKSKPETGAALVFVALALFGSLGALLGLVGGSSKTVKKSAKKVDGPSKAAAPVESTGKSTAVEEKTDATKRK